VHQAGTVQQVGIVPVTARVQGLATGPRIVARQGTVQQVVQVTARVLGQATGPRIVAEVAAIALEIEMYRQDQTAVLGEALSAAQAAVLAVHARAVREVYRAWEAPAAVVRVAVGEGGNQ
jgi:hypothetical protein